MTISAAQIKAARALTGMKQKELARASDVSLVSVRNIERGATDPRSSTLTALANALEAAGVEFTNGNSPGVRMRELVADQWYSPDQVLNYARSVGNHFVHQGFYKKAREAWGLALICKALGSERLRVLSDETVDGEYDLSGTVRQIELTEVLDKGRKRGDEYRPGAPRIRELPLSTESVQDRIAQAVTHKASRLQRKSLIHPVDVGVYFNLSGVFRDIGAELLEGAKSALEESPPVIGRLHVLYQTHGVASARRGDAGVETAYLRLPAHLTEF